MESVSDVIAFHDDINVAETDLTSLEALSDRECTFRSIESVSDVIASRDDINLADLLETLNNDQIGTKTTITDQPTKNTRNGTIK
ncbi:hypothetical protein GCM10007940_42300 [Portibacter lacus]|uniref:Uncharacterized protein n=1 Tax=Portibacter lacus TaxID=1099794 RepID=A0AA37SU29_9BACT|nr:hypothetical protein GCM10007940_42300 [Portibacter lacus]